MKNRSKDGWIQRYWYRACAGLIIVIAFFLRFYNYTSRFAFAGDQARDALVAREALRHLTLPLLGPFSSAGNFTTGFIWYTWLTLSTAIFPKSILTPWIVLSLTYVGIVAVMMVIGHKLFGKTFSLIVGLYTAVAPAQIIQSLNITNPSLVAVFSALALLFVVNYLDNGGYGSMFLLASSISLAISAHFQALYLVILVPFVLVVRKADFKAYVIALVGLLWPFIPYVLVDSRIGYYNLRGIVDYALYGQNKIYVPNRWLTYAFKFVPDLWSQIIGGTTIIGFIIILLTGITILVTATRRIITKSFFVISTCTLFIMIMLRYYKGERYFGYFVFLHPFILILTAWVSYECLKLNKLLGILLIAIIVGGSMYVNYGNIVNAVNYTYDQTRYWTNVLTKKYPDKKFDVYSVGNQPNFKGISLVLYLDSADKIDDKGYKIGFGGTPKGEARHYTLLKENTNTYDIWDLNSSPSAKLRKVGWRNINPSYIYQSTTAWYTKIHNGKGFKQVIDLILSKFK